MAGTTAGSLTGQQQTSMQQRTPPSGPPLSYPNNAPPGRPQPNSMHFQQHHSQPPGCYSTGPTGRTGCTQSSTGYPIVAGTDNGASSCRMSSPGPATGLNSTGDTDRLVCPITNGMVWGPTQIHLGDVMQQFLPDGVYVRRFEFDLTANHLQTIVGRTDLDIVVCSHLVSEPLQVCHWPSDAVQIRFNEYLLRLDRSSVHGGQSAHKVACVKQLCRPGRNQLEIAIVGLGEDPSQPATMAKRRAAASTLEMHRFAAFMAHMPALNVLLDGLQRRRPAGVSALCDILEGRVPSGIVAGSRPPLNPPVVAELSLICPVFRTRMRVPGRITGCEHIEAFDMEAFLRREVLWPRLNCPICGHKSPAGLDGLCIDTTILNALHLVHPSIDSVLVRSDGYWRLPPPICLDLPPDMDQWQPLIGPLTEVATQAFQSLLRGSILRGSMACFQPQSHAPTQQQQQQANLPVVSNSSDGPARNQAAPLQKANPLTRIVRANSTASSSCAQTPSLTPGKDVIGSPQWSSSSHVTGSPANQSFSSLVSATDRTVGSIVDSGMGDSTSSSRSQSTSRPASQPTSWGNMHSPLIESRSSATAGATPTITGSMTHPSPSPGSGFSDAPNQHQYPFSDPARTSPLIGPRTSSTRPDGCSSGQLRLSDVVDSVGGPNMGKIRRSSTGSSQTLLPPDSVLTGRDNNGLSDHLTAVTALPQLTEHNESGSRSVPLSGWSDSVPASNNVTHSPCLSIPSSQHPNSLPSSPSAGPRPSSANTVNFSIPAIPGVNMNAADRPLSSAHSPSVCSSPSSSKVLPPVATGSNPKMLIDSTLLPTNSNSPSPNLLPTTASVSPSFAEGSSGEPSQTSNQFDSMHESPTAPTCVGDALSSEKKLHSSLNMGLDFLLSEDQTNPDGEPGVTSVSVSVDDVTNQASSCENRSKDTDYPRSPTHLNQQPRVSESQISNHPLKRAHSVSDVLNSEAKSSEPCSVTKSGPQSIKSTTPPLIAIPESVHSEKSADDCQENSEATVKRIKLDPSLTPTKTEEIETIGTRNYIKSDPDSFVQAADEFLTNSKSAPLDTVNGVDELKKVAGEDNNKSNTIDGSCLPSSAAITTTTVKSDLPPIPTEFDESCTCAESIRALFAQIDRLEVFLDESYVRFVENFSCV